QIGFWAKETKKKWNKEVFKKILYDLVEFADKKSLIVPVKEPLIDDDWCCIDFVYYAEPEHNIETIDSYSKKF
ncbi:MAG: hypothetical protein J6Y69_02615, partial [Treponema sp.]|nr:hypothetical protein [Treponema sp.]